MAAVVLTVLLASVVLFVSAPRASAAVGPKTITVDGDPSEWTGTNLVPNTGIESNGEFVWNDSAGDDTGDGDYTYPKGPLNVTGQFDIREVRITADATSLYVLFKVGNNTNLFTGADGFATLSAILLIDTTRDGNGQTAAPPNVMVPAGKGWEYWVKFANTGWHPEAAKVFDAAGKWAPIVNRGDPVTEAVEGAIPLSFFGKDGTAVNGATWRFMFMLGGFAGERPPHGFRDVRGARWCCDWEFGGGDDGANDPEVIDIAFSATQAAQQAELGSYVAATTPATISSSVDVALGALGFTPDTTAPSITGVTVTPTFNSARIEWTTDEIANTSVHWGTTSGSLTNPVSRDEFVTSHSVLITGLTELTTYFYRIESCDIADNCGMSAEASFTTPAAPPSNIVQWDGPMFTWKDRTGDDVGDGNYVYPLEPSVDWPGKADITWINMTRTATALHIQAKVNANADPTGDWKQRMASLAIFIDQDKTYASGGASVGLVGSESGQPVSGQHPLNVSVAPNFGFEYLVVVNFMNRSQPSINDPTGRGEMMVFNSTYKASEQRWSLIYVSSAPQSSPEPDTGQIYARDGNVVDLWLNFSVIGDGGSNDNWIFLIAGMVYDDAARPFEQGGIRAVKVAVENWAGGGSNGAALRNPNVYDLAFYPDTPSQIADLSTYTATDYAVLTRGVRINFAALQHELVRAVPLTHSYALAWTASPTSVDLNENTTIEVTFTDNTLPVVGGSVSITTTSAAGSLVGSTVKTTGATGKVTFTFRGGSVTQDTTVSFTITASNDTATDVTATATVTVNAPAAPPPPGGVSPVLLAGIAILILIVIVAIALFMRRKKAPGAGGGTGG